MLVNIIQVQEQSGVHLIAKARERQIEKGYDLEHDKTHDGQELLIAAAALLLGRLPACGAGSALDDLIDESLSIEDRTWIFSLLNRSPEDNTEDLTIAGALIAAEIDRLKKGAELPIP